MPLDKYTNFPARLTVNLRQYDQGRNWLARTLRFSDSRFVQGLRSIPVANRNNPKEILKYCLQQEIPHFADKNYEIYQVALLESCLQMLGYIGMRFLEIEELWIKVQPSSVDHLQQFKDLLSRVNLEANNRVHDDYSYESFLNLFLQDRIDRSGVSYTDFQQELRIKRRPQLLAELQAVDCYFSFSQLNEICRAFHYANNQIGVKAYGVLFDEAERQRYQYSQRFREFYVLKDYIRFIVELAQSDFYQQVHFSEQELQCLLRLYVRQPTNRLDIEQVTSSFKLLNVLIDRMPQEYRKSFISSLNLVEYEISYEDLVTKLHVIQKLFHIVDNNEDIRHTLSSEWGEGVILHYLVGVVEFHYYNYCKFSDRQFLFCIKHFIDKQVLNEQLLDVLNNSYESKFAFLFRFPELIYKLFEIGQLNNENLKKLYELGIEIYIPLEENQELLSPLILELVFSLGDNGDRHDLRILLNALATIVDSNKHNPHKMTCPNDIYLTVSAVLKTTDPDSCLNSIKQGNLYFLNGKLSGSYQKQIQAAGRRENLNRFFVSPEQNKVHCWAEERLVNQGLNIVNELPVEVDGNLLPLPVLVLEGFLQNETRLNTLRADNECKEALSAAASVSSYRR